MKLEEYERLDPHATVRVDDRTEIVFTTPNYATAWRAETLLTKEPDTVEWIRGFDADSRLYDIGANVGVYTTLAAKWRGARVIAFEPEAGNYAILNRNIQRNGLADRATAYCVALSDSSGFDHLHLSVVTPGESCHSLGASVDHNNRPRVSAFPQGCMFTTLDALVDQGLPVPTDIKIDVDGIEPRVISGARRTLARPEVRSLLIEINTGLEDHWEIVDLMLSLGYDYSAEQVAAAQRKDGPFKGVGNYVFRR